ncbi:hypothetical protein AB1N83_003460 [Pleurotus pulmonarius]
MQPKHALTFCSALLFLCCRTGAVFINITVDDTLGDPTTGRRVAYHPASVWNDGANCSACNARPDKDFLYMGTWKDSSYDPQSEVPTASVTFFGTAVYVLCALSHSKAKPFGSSNMFFFIDNQLAGNFTRESPGTDGYDYNVTVFSQTNLPSAEHNLTIQNGRAKGRRTLMLLDAIIYTRDDGKSDSPSISAGPTAVGPTATMRVSTESASTSGTVVIAAVIGSTGGVALIILLYLLCHRHRSHRASRAQTADIAPGRRSPPSQPYITTPFVYEGPSSRSAVPSSEEAPPPYGYPQGKIQ